MRDSETTPPSAARPWRMLRLLRKSWAMRLLTLLGLSLGPLALANAGLPRAECETSLFKLRSDFPGAGIATCAVVDERTLQLDVQPEDGGRINPSPWYGFHVRALSSAAGELRVQLRYGTRQHRYLPKVSVDGHIWRRLPETQVAIADDDATLRLRPDERGFYLSAQENLNIDDYEAWQAMVAAHTGMTWRQIGTSLAERPIRALQTNPNAANVILLLGRQHPPEVSGALAFLRFAERLLELEDEACSRRNDQPADPGRCRFFQAHDFVLVPLMNPDGVANGHWRHNEGQTDLNRDWGPFRQPETQAVRDFMAELEARRKRLRLMLDFHSTRRNVFFTQDEDSPTRPANFAQRWIEAAKAYGPLYAFENAPRRLSEQGNAKNYHYRRFGVPSITYEVADEEDRCLVASSAAAFAEAMVDVFVAEDQAPPLACADAFCFLIEANRASLAMLAERKLLSPNMASAVAGAVDWIAEEEARPGTRRSANYLDMEARLLELAGTEASNIHLGRSRQDLHGTVRRMQARQRWLDVTGEMLAVRRQVLALATREANSPIPAYTHGVLAQPTTFGHYLLAFSAALGRDAARSREGFARLNRSPLGAAALGTSGFALDRQRLATLLGFDAPIENSFDANLVSSADYKLEFASILNQSAVTVGQFAQDLHTQYQHTRPWIVLRDDATSGSSIMPQKRNPRPIDRLRSVASKVIGKAQTTTLLVHNANTGMHDYRQITPTLALADDAEEMYRRYATLIDSLHLDSKRALAELKRGDSALTEVADSLVRLGNLPFRAAHRYASALVDVARSAAEPVSALTDSELQRVYDQTLGGSLPVLPQTIRDALDPAALIAGRRGFGGPQPDEMQRSLAAHAQALAADEEWLADTEARLQRARQTLRDTVAQLREPSDDLAQAAQRQRARPLESPVRSERSSGACILHVGTASAAKT